MKRTCWIPHPINNHGINILEENKLEISTSESFDSIVHHDKVVSAIFRTGKFTCTMMEHFPNLRVIAVHGVGTDGIDLEAATRKGIVVLNTPGLNSRSVAEHALALLFDLSKRLTVCDRAVRENKYMEIKYTGGFQEIYGRTLGIIGFGSIGQHLAKMAVALGMKVLVHTRQSTEIIAHYGCAKANDLADLLSESDYLSLNAPATAETYHLIDRQRLALMKPGACLINTSRGSLIDEAALADALITGKLAGAGLDVFEHEPLTPDSPLLTSPNLILTPHTAASSESAMRNMAMGVAQGILAVLNNQKPDSLINPAVWAVRRQ
ncbi:hydroxyacid dehydrogenase [Tatumella sp. UBA2305]|uniref:hydroxyacid dehydrogenase n=1 Tax=Tatumella sp. UBA2305 TaxID=1947647 RepID=UPI0025EBD917|nr:hydroxyacid dehydrogenase [Tatumella sp. UBA2305]